MSVIHVLDKHTAELIAAGEVVERPASVVKELLENSIDAGATQITVSIESGGVKLIEISDNGSGIEAEYIKTAFIRHATSKIEKAEDLTSIHTLGFRGEALASIASVARVEVLTRTQQEEFATSYCIAGGEEQSCELGARTVGTTIQVKDLFYNTPARMKFLKKDSSEGTFVSDNVSHVALSHPDVSIKFVREGKVQYVTPGDGVLRNAVYAILGREFSRDLINVDSAEGLYRVTGLITQPKNCRASRSMQHFFINGRYVRNRTIMAALETAFKGTTMQGKFPGGILLLDMPADLVDVNVHPAKIEVRFAHENDVFDVVYHAVKLALAQPGTGERKFTFESNNYEISDTASETAAKYNRFTGLSAVISGQADPGALPAQRWKNQLVCEQQKNTTISTQSISTQADAGSVNAVKAEMTSLPSWRSSSMCDQILEPTVTLHSPSASETITKDSDFDATFLPAANESLLDIEPETNLLSVSDAHERLAVESPSLQSSSSEPNFINDVHETKETDTQPVERPEQTTFDPQQGCEQLRYVGEIFKTYILTERGDELCLIDKHAAHERQIFEKLAADYGNVPSQILLQPVAVDLSAEEKQALLDNLSLLENVGIEISDFGGNTVVLHAVPADVEPKDTENLLVELADKLLHGNHDALNEQTEWILHSISCRAAIKAGDRSSPQELMALAEKILSGEVPPFCPHGRPCVLKLTRRELEKQFGRIV